MLQHSACWRNVSVRYQLCQQAGTCNMIEFVIKWLPGVVS